MRNISRRTFHALRHSFTSALANAGVAPEIRMKLTGHKTESVYRRYAIADQRALEEGVEKLARLHATTATESRKVVPMQEAAG